MAEPEYSRLPDTPARRRAKRRHKRKSFENRMTEPRLRGSFGSTYRRSR